MPVRGHERLTVAVLFGGASQEHDVSVVSAQQLMDAADIRRIEVVPVYLDFENRLLTGPSLRDVTTFRPRPPRSVEVQFGWGDDGPELRSAKSVRALDCILPVLHGPFGEDGRLQSLFELIGIPVAGFTASASALAMRKDATKALVKSVGINVLDHVTVNRAEAAAPDPLFDRAEARLGYPMVVKPANLGSSIGVGIALDRATLAALTEAVLRQDTLALIEPKVENLVEYNIAMRWRDAPGGGEIVFSAIERPKSTTDLLDFKEKYLSSDGPAKGTFLPSEGMLSLTREINPDLPVDLLNGIKDFARRAFVCLGHRGAPRIDFMSNAETGELWFNEINPIPGSYGFFLWEAAAEPLLYPELINHLVDEALGQSVKHFDDPVPQDAHLLPR
ncbi:MAG: D-alanine--D-alanine ligase [Pseudomonadota bacterium]